MWYVQEQTPKIRIINIPRIIQIEELNGQHFNWEEQCKQLDQLYEETMTSIQIEFYQGNKNLPDRFLTEFSLCKKDCIYDSKEHKFNITLHYSTQDEAELLIRLLSYDPYIKVIASDDNNILNKLKKRIDKQKEILNNFFV